MRYFLGFLAVIVLVVAVFILVLRGFGGKNEKAPEINLLDYATTQTVVKMTVDGPVIADQNHDGYSITIGRDANTIEVVKGYQGTVVDRRTYSNNTEAYAVFLRALQMQRFTKGDPDPKKTDSRGVCPNGSRYTFEIESGGKTIQRYWTSTCGGGTFDGSRSSIRRLFVRQIPDFPKITSKLRLGSN
jgi:hypothetical protein